MCWTLFQKLSHINHLILTTIQWDGYYDMPIFPRRTRKYKPQAVCPCYAVLSSSQDLNPHFCSKALSLSNYGIMLASDRRLTQSKNYLFHNQPWTLKFLLWDQFCETCKWERRVTPGALWADTGQKLWCEWCPPEVCNWCRCKTTKSVKHWRYFGWK